MQRMHDRQTRAPKGPADRGRQRLGPAMHMDDCVCRIEIGKQRRELRLGGAVPEPLRAKAHERRSRAYVGLVEQKDLDSRLDQARLDRPDRREKRHAMAATGKALRAVDSDFCCASIDMRVVVDDDEFASDRGEDGGRRSRLSPEAVIV